MPVEEDIVAGVEHSVCSLVHVESYGGEVINIGFVEILAEHRTAVAVDAHVGGLADAGCQKVFIRHLVHARLFHLYLHPVTRAEDGLVGVSMHHGA